MAANLLTRITALEQKIVKLPKAFRIICKGATPTPDEQQQIDEAEARGEFVICRLIVKPPKYDQQFLGKAM